MNRILNWIIISAKFKHWIESDWVSATTSPVPGSEEMGPVPVVVEEGSAQALAITHSLLSRSFHPFFSLLFGFSWFVLALTLWLLTHTAMKTRMRMMRRWLRGCSHVHSLPARPSHPFNPPFPSWVLPGLFYLLFWPFWALPSKWSLTNWF